MGIIEIKYVAHLPIGEWRVEPPELETAAKHSRLLPAAGLLQHRKECVDCLVPAAGERAADPVEHAALSLTLRRRRKIGETRRGEMPAQRLGQRHRIAIKILVHCQRSGIR